MNNDASLRDRATHEPSPDGLGHSVGIPSAGTLKVWWIPQVPMPPFEVVVPDLATASAILDALSDYDAFQFRTNIKGDYCNAGDLMIYEDGDWRDWEDEATGDSFDQWRAENLPRLQSNGWEKSE